MARTIKYPRKLTVEEIATWDRINKLCQRWYELVSLDHHKDQDCRWAIERHQPVYYNVYGEDVTNNKDYAYTNWTVSHHGYLLPRHVEIDCETLEEAQQKLIEVLEFAIRYMTEMPKRRDASEGIMDDYVIHAMAAEYYKWLDEQEEELEHILDQ